jgi:hypothetical protein
MYQNLYCYIDIDCEQYIENPDYFKKLYETVLLAYQHKITVYYNQDQIDNLKSFFSKNDDDWNKNYNKSHGFNLRNLLKSARKKFNKCYCFQVCFAGEKSFLEFINNEAVSIIEEQKNSALISLTYSECNSLLFVESKLEFKQVSFDVIKNKDDLLAWIRLFEPRNFNLSLKHGENGGGNWSGESVLRCNKKQAQILLNTAIADFNAKNSGKNLYNFDQVYNTFIEFYYEGDNPQKQWHGFHVEENQWKNRIPLKILKYFGKA